MEGQTSPSRAMYPTHQKNSTWDALSWDKFQPLAQVAGTGTSSMPSHRRGASMPPNLDEDPDAISGLPPIRYFDDVGAGSRPRLGHRTRGTYNSMGGDSDWTNPDRAGSPSSFSDVGSKDMLVAEPPPTHRRGGSIPMVITGGLGSLDFHGADGLLSSFAAASASASSVSNSAPNSARPQHRRSVTFQGTMSHSTDMFDFKLDSPSTTVGLASGGGMKRATTPPRNMTTTPPPPSSSSSVPAQQVSLPAPPPMMPQSANAAPAMMLHAPMAMYSQAMYADHSHQQHHHMYEYDRHAQHPQQQHHNHHVGVNGGMDPQMQLQLQMQQALIVQQQQWLLAMQQQQMQQQQQQQHHQQQHRGGGGRGVAQQAQQQYYPASPQPIHVQQQHAHVVQQGNLSPPFGPSSPPLGSSNTSGGSNSPIMRFHNGKQQQQHGSNGHHHGQQQQQHRGEHSRGERGGESSNHTTGSSAVGAANSAANSNSTDSVLSEYKTTGLRPKIEDLKGHVMAFATDAHGSRFLQYQMEIAKPEDKEMLVEETLSCAVALMQDTFGNYVIQNFLEHATGPSRRLLCKTMMGHMLQLSVQPHGCRVVQRALDLVDMDQRNELLGELLVPKGNVFQASRNTHATHVLQKTVSILRRDSALEASGNDRVKGSIDLMRAMEKAVADDVVALLLHPHAYRLVLNVLGDCDPSRSIHVARAVTIISDSRDQLCVDQHGNFMLQHMLDNTQSDGVLDFVRDRLVELSQHKFGSHLVEKCFAVASNDRCAQLVEELLRPTSERNVAATKKLKAQQGDGGLEWGDALSPALALMKDPYANFVVQKAFDRVQTGPLRTELMNLVQEKSELLQKFTYGRHILAHVMSARQGGGSSTTGSNSPGGGRSPTGSPYGAPKSGQMYSRQQNGGGHHHHQKGGNQVRG